MLVEPMGLRKEAHPGIHRQSHTEWGRSLLSSYLPGLDTKPQIELNHRYNWVSLWQQEKLGRALQAGISILKYALFTLVDYPILADVGLANGALERGSSWCP